MRYTTLSSLLSNKYIICSCEGSAEVAIIDLLLDANLLCFSHQDLVGEEPTVIRTGKDIEKTFLNQEYNKPVAILRILDRPQERLKLSRPYHDRFDIYDVCTVPEIEILIIINEGHWDSYRRHPQSIKPSQYCKATFGYSNIKKQAFFIDYFQNTDVLIAAIRKYNRLTACRSYNLLDLLTNQTQ